MIKSICSKLCILFLVFLFVGCTANKNENSSTFDESVVSTENNENLTFNIETDFAVLKYPSKYEKDIEVDKSENLVSFSCEKVKLFDISFNDETSEPIGKLKDGTTVSVISYEIDSKYDNYDKLCAMQEGINTVLDNLIKDYDLK